MGFKGQRIRTQLLVIFGGLVAVSFGIVLGVDKFRQTLAEFRKINRTFSKLGNF